MLSVKHYLTLILICSFSFLWAGNLTSEACIKDLELKLSNIPSNDKNNFVLEFVKIHNEDYFTSKRQYLSFLKQLEKTLEIHSNNYVNATYYIGKELQQFKEYKSAYPFLYKTALIVEDNPTEYNIPCDFFEVMAISYYFFGRYSEAEETFNKGINCDGVSKESEINIYNTLGLIYDNLNNHEKAKKYFIKAMEIARNLDNEAWFGVISGNLGNQHYKLGEVDISKKFIETDYNVSVRHGQWGSALNALSLLASIELRQGNYDAAKKKLGVHDSIRKIHNSAPNYYLTYYKSKTEFLEKTGDFKGALESYRLYKMYQDSMIKSRDILTIKNTEFQINFEKKQSEIQLLHETRKTDRVRIFSLWIVISTIIIGATILLWQITKRRKREKELMQLKNQKMEEDLNKLEMEMNQVLNNLIQKNEKINELNKEIHEVQSTTDKTEEMSELTAKLQSFTFLTDEDWVEFKRLFEKRHKGFFDYFEENHPSVTTAEIRLAALIKLKLEKLEMSKALGISPESVSKTNLRLRKKLNIKGQKELQSFIHAI